MSTWAARARRAGIIVGWVLIIMVGAFALWLLLLLWALAKTLPY